MGKILLILFLFLFSLSLIVPFVLAQDLKEPPEPPILGEGGVLDRITNYLFGILLIGATISIIVSGFYFITATGDPEKFNKAKMMVFYAIIGLLVAFSAKGIVMLIEKVGGGEEKEVIGSCSEYCKDAGLETIGCFSDCGSVGGRHFPDGDKYCPPTASNCCCL